MTSTSDSKPSKERTRAAVAKEFNVSESKLRTVQALEDTAPELVEKVRHGALTLKQAKRAAVAKEFQLQSSPRPAPGA